MGYANGSTEQCPLKIKCLVKLFDLRMAMAVVFFMVVLLCTQAVKCLEPKEDRESMEGVKDLLQGMEALMKVYDAVEQNDDLIPNDDLELDEVRQFKRSPAPFWGISKSIFKKVFNCKHNCWFNRKDIARARAGTTNVICPYRWFWGVCYCSRPKC